MFGRTAQRIAWVLLTLLLAEGAARALEPRFPAPPEDWGTPELQYKLAIRPAEGADVLVIGTSDMDAGVTPEVLDSIAAPERPTFNGSLGATSLRVVAEALEELWLPQLKPKVVIVGVLSAHLNANNARMLEIEERFFSAPEVKALRDELSVMEQVDRTFAEWSSLWAHREHLRSWDALNGRAVEPWSSLLTTSSGQWQRFLDAKYAPTDELFDFVQTGALKDWDINPEWDKPLRRVVAASRSHDAEVLVVLSPVASDWTTLHPNGQRDVDRFHRAVSALLRELDVPLIRPEQFDDDLFADVIHLNREGAAKLSELLGRCVVDIRDCPVG